ncbi:hypothetical protein [Amycolatopsis alkalitolerans]|uniref:Uncharacterized protein n=1 Tax=Amycolatopsis alkalitolerans TaxID=2547244 RepID=A0A5C4M3G1_9PSEU|nr:hypothetical protein [Amycolatopsis alkalitolerans]TNC27603.1 hypothetical protein FG385_07665 [Amycolatopsis alkalitolerans]
MRTARLVAGYAAILGTLPYLTLKVVWLTGGTLGLTDPGLVRTTGMAVANGFTGGMDLVAIAIALTVAHRWGERVTAWLVLFPLWVGTGFLAPIALSGPVIGVDLAVTDHGSSGLEPWVTPLVYGCFIWQGLTLLTAFVLYARMRWAPLFTARTSPGLSLTAGIGVAIATMAAAVHVIWTFAPIRDGASVATRFLDGVDGVLALAAAVGMLLLAREHGRFRWPMVLVWAGSATLFAWGFWSVFTTVGMTSGETLFETVMGYAQALAGVLLGLGLLAKARAVR